MTDMYQNMPKKHDIMHSTLKQGDIIELVIDDIAFGGDGVGRFKGMAVFVPFVIEGERVTAEITEVRKRFARARLAEVNETSPYRVDPVCPYYTNCPGCRYQHVAYEHQLSLKEKQVSDLFQRIGKQANPAVAAIAPSPHPYGYRNKVVLHGPGNPGYWGFDGKIVPIEHCPVARREINECIRNNRDTVLGVKEHLAIRVDAEGKAVMPTGSSSGRMLTERIRSLKLQVPENVFFQANPYIIPSIADSLRKEFTNHECRALIDAYCGVGLFTLIMADKAMPCIGLEENRTAVLAAENNAVNNGFGHVVFRVGPVEKTLESSLAQCDKEPVCVILDPPRSGCSRPVLKLLVERKPSLVIYISCAPDRLARDVRMMVDGGYKLERLLPFDMCPQTAHLEVMAVLSTCG